MIVVIRATRVEMDGGARERGSSCDICTLLSLSSAGSAGVGDEDGMDIIMTYVT